MRFALSSLLSGDSAHQHTSEVLLPGRTVCRQNLFDNTVVFNAQADAANHDPAVLLVVVPACMKHCAEQSCEQGCTVIESGGFISGWFE